MSFDNYSWDSGEGKQDDPWGSLLPSYAQPERTAQATPPASTPAPVPSPWGAQNQPGMPPPPTGYGQPATPPAATRAPNTAPAIAGQSSPASVDGNFFLSLVNGKPPSPQTLHAMETELAQHGIQILRNARGWADKIRLPNGQVYDVIEAATANGGKKWQLLDDSGGGAVDRTARGLMSSLSADGHDVKSVGYDRLMIDGRPYQIKPAPDRPTWQPTWAPGERLYTPGEITMDDLEGYGYQDVAGRLKTDVTDATDDLMLSILKNPEGLSEQMVDTLKARRADEIAGIASADEDALMRFGFSNNLGDSRWLASERLAGQRARDEALIGSNQEIDIKAAETRMADRRSAAQLGTAHGAEQRAREALANDTGLRQAALKGDRMALRESIAQKAAELEIDQNQVVQQWAIAVMDDITKRWGIEVDAELDITRMSMQSQQWQEDLMFKLTQLDQQAQLAYEEMAQDDRQFGADYGLRAADLELRRQQDLGE